MERRSAKVGDKLNESSSRAELDGSQQTNSQGPGETKPRRTAH